MKFKLLKRVVAFVTAAVMAVGTLAVLPKECLLEFEVYADSYIDIWDGTALADWKGAGTEEDPYLISTPEQFAALNGYSHTETVYYKQTCDLYFNDVTNYDSWTEGWSTVNFWKSFGLSNVSYDGADYSIYGIFSCRPYNKYYNGIFSSVSNSEIKNVNVKRSLIYGSENVGGIAGYVGGNTQIKNCSFEGKIKGNEDTENLGGIVGEIYSGYSAEILIDGCENRGLISGNSSAINAGGIVGKANSYNGSRDSISTITIRNCGNYGNVISPLSSTGGIIGYFTNYRDNIEISECFNVGGTISGKLSGGIAGFMHAEWANRQYLKNCYNTSDIFATEDSSGVAGGIVGYLYVDYLSNNNHIDNCFNIGNVKGNEYAGGIVGHSAKSSAIDMTGTTRNIGNLLYNAGRIECAKNAYAISNYLASNYVYSTFFYLEDTCSNYTSDSISKELSFIEMTSSDSFSGFDFSKIWEIDPKINNGMPYLRFSTEGLRGENTQGKLDSAILGDKNLVSTYHKYYLKLLGDGLDAITEDPEFSIVCTLSNKYADPKKFQLYKGKERICESSNGVFTVKEKSLLKDGKLIEGDVFVNVVAKDGSNTKTKLKLDIAQSTGNTDNFELSLFGESRKVAIPDNVPIIGGSDLSLSGMSFPIYATVKSDGTIRVGINICDKDLLDKDSRWNNFKNCYESNKKLKDADLKNFKNDVLNKKNLNELKTYLSTTKNKNFKLFDPNQSVDVTVAGYGEGKLTGDGFTSVAVSITVGIEYNGSISWQTFVVAVPVLIEGSVKAGASATGNLKWDYDTSKQAWDFTGELLIDVEVGLEVFAGVGVKKVASVGVNGGGKINMSITALSNKKTSGIDTIDGTLYAGIKVKFLSFTYSKNFAERTWNLYSRDPESSIKTANVELLADVYNQEEYVLECDEINETVDLSASGDSANDSVVSGIQCSASPEIVSVNNGILMTYLSEDSERGTANASVLKYMFYDNVTKTWTAADQVDGNNTADWYSKLYSFGGKTYLIYSQANEIFGEDVRIEEMLASMKITVAEYDAENNTFINFEDISSTDGRYNSMPMYTVLNNNLTALWVNSSSDDIFLQNNGNSVQYSVYANGTWSSPVTAAKDLNTITSLAGGSMNGSPYIAVCSNNSTDLSVSDNNQITIYDIEGNIIKSAEGNVDNIKFTKLPNIKSNAFVWYNNGNIEYTTDVKTTEALFVSDEDSRKYITSDYAAVDDGILYIYTNNDGKSSIYQTIWDNGKWVSPVLVESADGFISAFSANESVLVYSDTLISADGEEVSDSTSIDICRFAEKYDIEAAGVDFDYTQIVPGQIVDLNLLISNNSDNVLKNVTVTFSKGSDVAVSEEIVECNIAPGEYAEVTVPFTVPSSIDNTVFTAKLSGDKTDTSPENNSIEFDFSKTELVLSVSERVLADRCIYIADIKNASNISTSGTLKIYDASDNIVHTAKIDSIPANKTISYLVNMSVFSDGGKSDIYTSEIISDKEEYFTNNNIVSENFSIMNDDIPYIIVAFMDNNGNEISRNVYNIGDDIIIPEFPDGTDIWTVLNDDTLTPVTDFSGLTVDTVFVAQKAPLPKAEVIAPVSHPIILGQKLKDAVLTEGWVWADDTIKPSSIGEFTYTAYMDVSDYDKYDYSDVIGYDEATHRITRTVSVTVIEEVIIGVEVTDMNVIVSYGYSDSVASPTRTVTLEFDEVTENIVEYMSSDIDLIIAFVNAFSSENTDVILTPAEMKAIEIVLEHDYGEE